VLVVSRWFGGTKLGRGGLIRAYGECAAETIRLLKIVESKPVVQIAVECGYEHVGLVENIAARFKGQVEGGDYKENVKLHIKLPVGKEEEFIKTLTDESRGMIRISAGDLSI
jgi:putative IMPACT (imprinted ancient) family translation regulator